MVSFSNWFRNQRKNLLLLLFSTLLTLIVGEACLQLFYRMSMKSWLWQFNAFHVTFAMPVADRRQYALRPDFSDPQIGVSVNRKGFRSPPSTADIDAQTPVVVTLGDSKAFGSGVRDDETYAFYIDRLLQEKKPPFRAVNGGIASYNSRQAIDRFQIDVLPNYKPAVVVFQGAFNDISLLSYYRENWNPDRTWADIRFAGFQPPLPMFQKVATFYYINKIVTQRSQQTFDNTGKDVTYQAFPDEAMLANLRNEMQAFLALCESKSIPVVLMPIDPFYYQTANTEKNPTLPLWAQNSQYVEMWKEMIRHHDDLLFELSGKNDLVYFFDSRKVFDGTDRSNLYVDAFHYSPEGNRLLAEKIYEFLNEKNLLAAKAGQ